jgi:hypothetical protein
MGEWMGELYKISNSQVGQHKCVKGLYIL